MCTYRVYRAHDLPLCCKYLRIIIHRTGTEEDLISYFKTVSAPNFALVITFLPFRPTTYVYI